MKNSNQKCDNGLRIEISIGDKLARFLGAMLGLTVYLVLMDKFGGLSESLQSLCILIGNLGKIIP
ncbi:MAG: hypothetical protein EOM72_04455 [Opitutae bacterium]|nr:hypothetical protein [Opitutae bacterium]